jgi:hypothetical protein
MMLGDAEQPYVVVLGLPVVMSSTRRACAGLIPVRVAFVDAYHHHRMDRDHYEPIFHRLYDWVKETTQGKGQLLTEMPELLDLDSDDSLSIDVYVTDLEPWSVSLFSP